MNIHIELSPEKVSSILQEEYVLQLPKDWNNIAIRKSDRNDEYKYCFKINYPCFHPAISIHGHLIGSSIEDCKKQFYNLDYACRDIYNIDAGIMYKKYIMKFIEINQELLDTIDMNCQHCSKKLTNDNISYFGCHIFHIDCIVNDKLKNCPVCNKKWHLIYNTS
ncbi:MAG: hypothetical protein MUO21_06700 [Nitrososphaeraceae archaeon]|nr:hypothetical protein [Nitrososphaeraceae archaeon]